jgi:aspartate-semialdehyde dehydrogenase
MDPKVPLVVPEIKRGSYQEAQGDHRQSECSTIQMIVAFYPLHRVKPDKTHRCQNYQSVSGTGIAAIDELTNQSKQILNGQTAVPHVYRTSLPLTCCLK